MKKIKVSFIHGIGMLICYQLCLAKIGLYNNTFCEYHKISGLPRSSMTLSNLPASIAKTLCKYDHVIVKCFYHFSGLTMLRN